MASLHSDPYFPEPGTDWRRARPKDVGLDPVKLSAGTDHARKCDSQPYWGDDYAEHKAKLLADAHGPHADVDMVGPFTPPSAPNGLIVRRGVIVAEFGDTDSVTEIASGSKSFLSAVAGLTFDRGLFKSVHDPVCDSVDLQEFSGAHNSRITWHHLLRQTSEWDGVLFGKKPTGHSGARVGEDLYPPGSFFEYNDVRVNLLAYSLLHIWKRPLPEVLKEYLMDPIGASDSWQWHGYETSAVEIDGRSMTSVSGGAHWGGGIWMNARDLARFGHLYLHNGTWQGKTVLSRQWIEMTRVSCDVNYMYGYMWRLKHDDRDRQVAFAAQGAGGHTCTVIPDYDMVVVGRWVEGKAYERFFGSVLESPKDVPHLGMPVTDSSRVNAMHKQG